MEELEFYKNWCLVFVNFDKEVVLNGNYHDNKYKKDMINDLNDCEQRILTCFQNKDLRRLKMFAKSYANDTNSCDPEYSILNARLRAACGKDLRDFDKKRLDKVRKIEERGYIKTNSEYYQIRNHIDYLEATNGTDEKIKKFDTMISLYEEKIREKMEKQKKKRDRQE